MINWDEQQNRSDQLKLWWVRRLLCSEYRKVGSELAKMITNGAD